MSPFQLGCYGKDDDQAGACEPEANGRVSQPDRTCKIGDVRDGEGSQGTAGEETERPNKYKCCECPQRTVERGRGDAGLSRSETTQQGSTRSSYRSKDQSNVWYLLFLFETAAGLARGGTVQQEYCAANPLVPTRSSRLRYIMAWARAKSC